MNQASFSIVRYFLPNRGRILPALTEKSKIKKLPLLGIEPTYCASKESVGYLCQSFNLIKLHSIDFRSEQSSTCEVVHETNEAHFRSLLPIRFLTSTVSRAID